MPLATAYFVLAALTGIGVPCLASFWAELAVFMAAFNVYPLYGTLAICALAVSALFILRVVQQTCFGPARAEWADLQDVTPGQGLPRLILVAAIALFGLFPALMFDMIQSAALPFINGTP